MSAKWIEFKLMGISVSGKTKAWSVMTLDPISTLLGEIRWYGRWRKYSFFPNRGLDLVFEKDCMRDLADFCEEQTKLQRAGSSSPTESQR